jgi:uncharacterized protein YgbK (DUF1537 family)
MHSFLLAYYGDDFTGSTDALEFLCRAGVKTVLFLDTPNESDLLAFPDMDAFGIAGISRSLDPVTMEQVLTPIFEKLKALQIPLIHYKVCSTFDSASHIGSIGKAIDIGKAIFKTKQIPVIGGVPILGRYCMFGNLFARMGIGSNGKIYRLDRHPSMRNHPVTPSLESDLTVLLSQQTNATVGLIDMQILATPINEWSAHVADKEIIVLDTINETHIHTIGAWLGQQEKTTTPLMMVGGSSVEMALGNYWNTKKIRSPKITWVNPSKASPLLVVSGSCSPVSIGQIQWAIQNGFKEILLDVNALLDDETVSPILLSQVAELLLLGDHVIVHTGIKSTNNIASSLIGTALGTIAKYAVHHSTVRRVLIAGGDTSSYAGRAMGIHAVEMIAPLIAGAPLCKAHSKDEKIQGIEVNFKGGQVGAEDYFQWVLEGASKQTN